MQSFKSLIALSTTALLAACGGGGGSSAPTSTPAVVTPTPVNPTASIKSSTDQTVAGTNITLTWSSTNATTCTASGAWAGDVGASGTKDVSPVAGASQYTVTCGTATSTANVNALPSAYAVPDSNFEAVLVAQGLDDVVDGKVNTVKALTATELKITAPAGITDMTGLEAFRNLTKLQVEQQTGLTKIDVTALTKLTAFNVWNSPITTIDVSKNTALVTLGLSQTELTTVDVSALVNIEELALHNDVDNPEAKTYPYGVTKGLTSLNVSKNVNLKRLYVGFNRLTAIDVSANTKLTDFWGVYNQFVDLDFSKNSALSIIVLTNTTKMTSPLKSLNIKGVAGNGVPTRLYTTNNPLLKEIRVTSLKAIQDYLATKPADASGYFQDSWTAFTQQ
jgi:Leucine-rich repeat (LRR) protein